MSKLCRDLSHTKRALYRFSRGCGHSHYRTHEMILEMKAPQYLIPLKCLAYHFLDTTFPSVFLQGKAKRLRIPESNWQGELRQGVYPCNVLVVVVVAFVRKYSIDARDHPEATRDDSLDKNCCFVLHMLGAASRQWRPQGSLYDSPRVVYDHFVQEARIASKTRI